MIADPSGVVEYVVPVIEWPLAIIATLVAGFGFFFLAKRYWISDRFDFAFYGFFSFFAAGVALLFSAAVPYSLQMDGGITAALESEFDQVDSLQNSDGIITADVTIDGEAYSILASQSTDPGTITYYIIEEQP